MKYLRFHKDNIIIHAYRGFGSKVGLYLRGRILEDENITITKNASLLKTIRNNFYRWESDEVPHVPVNLQLNGRTYDTVTDGEGYFNFEIADGLELPTSERWHRGGLNAEFDYQGEWRHITTSADFYLPSVNAEFGIISDVDDTILQTDVLFRFRLLRNTFARNSFQREQIEGMSHWINALRKGKNGLAQNPIFYVSKSPRNLFDYLANFLDINGFPKGPILLRDFARQGSIAPSDYLGHKEDEIERILNTYPNLPFIFFGDIAGHDFQIYHYIQQKYPDQVLAIYIRDIKHRRKRSIFHSWRKRVQPQKMMLIESSREGLRNGIENGWVDERSLAG